MRKALLLPVLFLLLVSHAEAAGFPHIKKVRYSSNASHTRVVIDLTGPVKFSQERIFNPERIFFDLKNCNVSGNKFSRININDKILDSVRIAQYKRDVVRVVFDVKDSGKHYAFMLENPHRLVIDVYSGEKEKTKEVKVKPRVSSETAVRKPMTVVIDPGHGGKDPGAVGPRGLQEKDVVLSVGEKLGSLLKEQGIKVVYTRKKDVYIPLNERTEIANAANADLFVSIHVNASPKRDTRGIETYFLNWTNNKEAMRVAARENKISLGNMKKVQDELQLILSDLSRNSKREESMKLAYNVQNALVDNLSKSYGRIEDLGVKYALFYVLVGAEMPSVLVEISFISNAEEEKRLTRESYRARIAESIASGISSYLKDSTFIAGYGSEIQSMLVSDSHLQIN